MRKITFTLFLALSSLTVFSQNPAGQIVARAKTVKTLSADFVQTKSIASLSEPAVGQGKIYFATPDKMRWEQNKPSSFLMVFAGKSAKIKIGEAAVQEFNASSNRMFKELSGIIIGGITGEIFTNQKNYKITFEESRGRTKATLVPQNKQMLKYISSIEMIFNAEWLAEQIVMNEVNGKKTTIDFTAMKVNNPISANLFILK